MSCSPIDLKDYFLKELPSPQQRQVEVHLKTCSSCREEVERLRLTETALFALREEEIPQRIAFVSDPVFEPSRVRRWLAAFWGSGARLGFASAAMLSAAILVSALTRPAPAPVLQFATAPVPAVTVRAPEGDIQQRIQAAVEQAVAASEVRQAEKTHQLVAELGQSRKQLQLAAAEFAYYQKRANLNIVADAHYGMKPLDAGDPK